MHSLQFFVVILSLFLLSGCAEKAVKIDLTYRTYSKADFRNFKTFGIIGLDDDSSSVKNQMTAEIAGQLIAKGYSYQESNPDFVVAVVYYDKVSEIFDPTAGKRINFNRPTVISWSGHNRSQPMSAPRVNQSLSEKPSIVVHTQKKFDAKTSITEGEYIGSYVKEKTSGIHIYFLKMTPGQSANISFVFDPGKGKVFNIGETETLWEAEASFSDPVVPLNTMLPRMVSEILVKI